ncbi:angiopoietin-related protein 7-like [Argopecten irradians]|uniref:angiopoietin-related protein 7-like n=1 Tax=Argopecten irradians TaxID=31199 RepID=UPI003724BFBC
MVYDINLFSRIHHVIPTNFDPVTSNTEIQSRGMCAMRCKQEYLCLSFSYTETDRRCDTYAKALVEEENADLSNSTMYFTKDIVQGNNEEASQAAHAESTTVAVTEGIGVPWSCDIDNSSSWIVIQRRTNGNLNFTRSWADYKSGFGNLEKDCWIGNDNLHLLTTTSRTLRVELEAWDGTPGYAQYSGFQVANENRNYRIFLTGFSGNIFDALKYMNDSDFSTFDRDNDKAFLHHCSKLFRGGWWYNACFSANLNGQYMVDNGNQESTAMVWESFPISHEEFVPLKSSKMMLI